MDSSSLQDEPCVSCIICYNKYDRVQYQPCTLVCGHTLCIPCARRTERCPNCRKVSGNRNRLQPNYEIMKMVEYYNRMKLRSIETQMKHHSQYWNSVKSEEDLLEESSKELRNRYLKMESEMINQKELVEAYYNKFNDDWNKKYALLLKSQFQEEELLSGMKKGLKRFSSPDSIIEMEGKGQTHLDEYLAESEREFEIFKSNVLGLKSAYQDISVDPPLLQDFAVTLQIIRSEDRELMIIDEKDEGAVQLNIT